MRRVSMFAELEQDALREVAKKLQTLSLPRGAIVYREGEQGDALYIMELGRVKIVTLDEEGKEKEEGVVTWEETSDSSSLLPSRP